MYKVAVFSESFQTDGGGRELATYLILKLLANEKNFEINIYTGTRNQRAPPGTSLVYVNFLNASNKLLLFWKIYKNKHTVERIIRNCDIIYIPRFSYPVIPIAKKLGKTVIVHLHDYQPISFTSIVFAKEEGMQTSDLKRTFILEHIDKGLTKAVASTVSSPIINLIKSWVSMANTIVCVSRRQEEVLLNSVPDFKGRTTVIYNPPPNIPKIRKCPERMPTFLYIGGSSYVKGFQIFLKASQWLLRTGCNVKFIFAGKYKSQLINSLSALNKGNCNNYIILGELSRNELFKLYEKVWALVFPSICEEPLPYAVFESMFTGTIPIAAKVGGVPEIVEGTFAKNMLFEPFCVKELVNKMKSVITLSKDELINIGIELREATLKKFPIYDIKRQLLKIFTNK